MFPIGWVLSRINGVEKREEKTGRESWKYLSGVGYFDEDIIWLEGWYGNLFDRSGLLPLVDI